MKITQMKLTQLGENTIVEITKMLKALSDPTRLKIMQALHAKELCVSEIVDQVNTGQANVSKHLQLLAQVSLVKSRREGTTIYYSLLNAEVKKMCQAICQSYGRILEQKYQSLQTKKKV